MVLVGAIRTAEIASSSNFIETKFALVYCQTIYSKELLLRVQISPDDDCSSIW